MDVEFLVFGDDVNTSESLPLPGVDMYLAFEDDAMSIWTDSDVSIAYTNDEFDDMLLDEFEVSSVSCDGFSDVDFAFDEELARENFGYTSQIAGDYCANDQTAE